MSTGTTNIAMSAAYDTHSKMQQHANERQFSYLLESLLSVDQPGRTISIADFGCATGLNSMKLFSNVLTTFRKRSNTEVVIYHNDLPQNLWSVLFTYAGESPHSYLTIPGTYTAAIGRSFYGRLLPSNSLSLGYTTWALHWLSAPLTVPGQLRLQVADDGPFMAELEARSSQDLLQFLRCRAEELVIGGRLVLHMPASKLSLEIFLESMQGLVSSGRLPAHIIDQYPVLTNSVKADVLQRCIDSCNGRLQLVSPEVVDEPDPLFKLYLADNDAAAYGQKAALMLKAVLGASIVDVFKQVGTDTNRLSEEFFEEVRNRLVSNPRPAVTSEMFAVVEKIA